MAPEHPPELVIFDSRFEERKLKGNLYYVEVPIGTRLRVRWDCEVAPEDFQPVGEGVAYVLKSDQLVVLPVSRDSIPDDLGDLRYRWSEGLNFGIPSVMFVLILPTCHTLVGAKPIPSRAKIFEGRLALYWILRADDLGRTQVECTLQTFKGSASSKLVELNRFCSGESPPRDGAIEVEDKSPSTSKRVFISYSHDSDVHRKEVLGLSERLRADGIETLLDQYVNGTPPQGWPRWMLDQIDAADSVLVICTETYYRRFRGHEEPGKGRGGDWEGALITSELYEARSRIVKFIPILLSGASEDCIPEPLRSGTHFALTSEEVYENLYDFLLEQAGVEPHPIGTLKRKGRRKGIASTFEPSSVGAARELVSPQEFVDDRVLDTAESSGAISLSSTMPFRQPDPQSRRSPNRGIRRIFIGSWRGWLALVILGLTAAGVVYMKKEVQKTAKPDFGREPVKETIFVAAGVEARITGADGDLFEIWRDGARIYFHRIQDGQHLSKADVKSVSVGGSDYNIAVRHGTDRDIFFCYAIRETSVYRNPSPVRFGQGQPGNNFDFEWISPTTLRIRYPKGLGYVDWQPITKTWSVRG